MLRSNFTTTVDDIDNCGTTSLMDAVRSGSTEIFDLLVQFGADITRRNKAGFNCLHIAAEVGAGNVINHLVQVYNFDVNELTDQGSISMTAIQIAKKVRTYLMLTYPYCRIYFSLFYRKINALPLNL